MASIQEKALSVLWFHETKLAIKVLCKFQRCYGYNPPHAKAIKYERFKETGSVVGLTMSEAFVDHIQQSFQRRYTKLTPVM